jgi:NifU-like protein
MNPPLWELYSKKIRSRLDRPQYAGCFSLKEAQERGMRLVKGYVQNGSEQLCLYWLVDELDGVIADARYQVSGPTGLIAAAEAASESVLRKNYDQASRLSVDLLDRLMRDQNDRPAFPEHSASHLNQALDAIDLAVQQCLDIPFLDTFDMTPIEDDIGVIPGGLPGWDGMPHEQKLKIIEEVIEKEVRPYIALDAGGIKILDLHEGREVRISYEGACVGCHSSTGSTLQAIQRILRARVHPELSVIPDLDESS